MLGGFSLVAFWNDLLQSCSESLHLTKMKVLCLLLRRKSHLSGWNVKGVQIFDGRYTKEELFLSKIKGLDFGADHSRLYKSLLSSRQGLPPGKQRLETSYIVKRPYVRSPSPLCCICGGKKMLSQWLAKVWDKGIGFYTCKASLPVRPSTDTSIICVLVIEYFKGTLRTANYRTLHPRNATDSNSKLRENRCDIWNALITTKMAPACKIHR